MTSSAIDGCDHPLAVGQEQGETKMTTIYESNSCCGLREISNLQGSKDDREAMISILSGYADRRYYRRVGSGGLGFGLMEKPPKRLGQLIFTQADKAGQQARTGYGKSFAKFIRENDLGVVTESEARAPNQNYPRGHFITTFVWTPNCANLWKWWLEVKPTLKIDKETCSYGW